MSIFMLPRKTSVTFWVDRWIRTVLFIYEYFYSYAMLDVFKAVWVGLDENVNILLFYCRNSHKRHSSRV